MAINDDDHPITNQQPMRRLRKQEFRAARSLRDVDRAWRSVDYARLSQDDRGIVNLLRIKALARVAGEAHLRARPVVVSSSSSSNANAGNPIVSSSSPATSTSHSLAAVSTGEGEKTHVAHRRRLREHCERRLKASLWRFRDTVRDFKENELNQTRYLTAINGVMRMLSNPREVIEVFNAVRSPLSPVKPDRTSYAVFLASLLNKFHRPPLDFIERPPLDPLARSSTTTTTATTEEIAFPEPWSVLMNEAKYDWKFWVLKSGLAMMRYDHERELRNESASLESRVVLDEMLVSLWGSSRGERRRGGRGGEGGNWLRRRDDRERGPWLSTTLSSSQEEEQTTTPRRAIDRDSRRSRIIDLLLAAKVYPTTLEAYELFLERTRERGDIFETINLIKSMHEHSFIPEPIHFRLAALALLEHGSSVNGVSRGGTNSEQQQQLRLQGDFIVSPHARLPLVNRRHLRVLESVYAMSHPRMDPRFASILLSGYCMPAALNDNSLPDATAREEERERDDVVRLARTLRRERVHLSSPLTYAACLRRIAEKKDGEILYEEAFAPWLEEHPRTAVTCDARLGLAVMNVYLKAAKRARTSLSQSSLALLAEGRSKASLPLEKKIALERREAEIVRLGNAAEEAFLELCANASSSQFRNECKTAETLRALRAVSPAREEEVRMENPTGKEEREKQEQEEEEEAMATTSRQNDPPLEAFRLLVNLYYYTQDPERLRRLVPSILSDVDVLYPTRLSASDRRDEVDAVEGYLNNMLIRIYGLVGRADTSAALLGEMQTRGKHIDPDTLDAIVFAYACRGNASEALANAISLTRVHGVLPTPRTLERLVRCTRRAAREGHEEELGRVLDYKQDVARRRKSVLVAARAPIGMRPRLEGRAANETFLDAGSQKRHSRDKRTILLGDKDQEEEEDDL